MRTSFHHQPEAQHPKSSAIHKLPAAAGEKLGVQLVMLPVRTVEDFEGAFSTMSREHVGGFLVVASPLFSLDRARLADLALKHRLPGMFWNKENVEAGALMSYAADFNDMGPRAATCKSSRAPTQPPCRWSRHPNPSWSSTSRPPRRLVSPFPNRSCCAPTR